MGNQREWKISESDTKFVYDELLPLKILGIRLGSIVHLNTWRYPIKVLALGKKVLALSMKVPRLCNIH